MIEATAESGTDGSRGPGGTSSWLAMIGIAIRRLMADRAIVASTAALIIVGMVQLAAAPIYTRAVSVGALRWSVLTAPADQSVVEATISTTPETLDTIDPVVLAELRRSLPGVSAETSRRLVTGSFALPDQPSEERTDLTVLTSVTGVADHATMLDGAWPRSQAGEGPILAAIEEEVAGELGFAVGDVIDLVARPGDWPIQVEVVGRYRLDDRGDRFWTGQPLLSAGALEAPTYRTLGPLVVDEGDLLAGRGGRVTAHWLADPDLDRLTDTEAERLAAALSGFSTRLEEGVGGLDQDITRRLGRVDGETGLPRLLVDTTRSVAVSRAGVLALSAQLTVLAGLALALGAGQLWEARRAHTALVMARGGGRAHLMVLAAVEAVVLVVPAALAAPALAVLVLRALGRWGPLSSIGFPVEPEVGALVTGPVLLAGLAMIAILVLPAARSPRVLDPAGRHRRQGRGAAMAGLGLDVGLGVLTVGALWQLGRLGNGARSVVGDRFGVDPLLIVAPALALATGAVLTLRLIPLLVRSAEGLVDRTRSVIGALAGWQIARRPAEQARAVFLLALALAIGGFGAAHAETWRASQSDQADQQVGAAVRVFPDRRTGQSMDSLHLVTAHRDLAAVEAVAAVTRGQGSLPASDEPGVFLAIDGAAAPTVVRGRDDGLAEAMAAITAARPRWSGLALPAGAVALSLEVTAVEEPVLVQVESILDPATDSESDPNPDSDSAAGADDPAAEPEFEELPLAFDGWLDVLIQDGDGLLHRRQLGRLTTALEPASLRIDLADSPGAGRPSEPLTIVGLELRLPVPEPPARSVELTVGRLTADGDDGRSIEIPIVDGSTRWRASTTIAARLAEAPSLLVLDGADGTAGTDGAGSTDLGLRLATGSSPVFFGGAQSVAVFELRPGHRDRPDALPVAADARWLAASGTEIGDPVDLPAFGLNDRAAVVAAAVDGFPTVDPAGQLVVVADLATLQALTYEPGRRLATIDELWLATADPTGATDPDGATDSDGAAPAPLATTLTGPPFNSAGVEDRAAVEAGLLTDPVALAPIAAYTIGAGAALALAVVVFATGTALSGRLRRPELLLLRAIGLSPGQIARWLAVEHLLQLVIAAASGLAVGLALSLAILPRLAVDRDGRPVLPAPRTVIPWDTVALIGLVPLAALAIILVIQVRAIARATGAAEVRGEGG